jgi:hypothetical protein
LLNRQKEALPHRMFLPWIESEFGMSERPARKMMNVATTFAAKSAPYADLTLQAIYELAAPSTPEEVRTEVERRMAVRRS